MAFYRTSVQVNGITRFFYLCYYNIFHFPSIPNFIFLATFFLYSECGKGFRYKVSQRSHKCSGALLERQPGDLIQKLMQNSSILPLSPSSTAVSNDHIATTPSTNAVNNSISNQNENEETQHEPAALDLCLDDLLKESYEKLMKVQLSPSQILVAGNGFENNTTTATFESDNNASMAINSCYLTTVNSNNNTLDFNSTLETINEDSIKELLYGHVGWHRS